MTLLPLCEGNPMITGGFPHKILNCKDLLFSLLWDWTNQLTVADDLWCYDLYVTLLKCHGWLLSMYIMIPGLVGTSQRAKILESTLIRHRSETFVSYRCLIEIDPRFIAFLVIISSPMSHMRHSVSILQQYWCLDSFNFLWSVIGDTAMTNHPGSQ